jgi:effector-binding domain-containing protein
MSAAYVHSMNANPEEEALKNIFAYAENNGLTNARNRLFGRNTYPTDKPEPHGYEYFLIQDGPISEGEIDVAREVPGGLYAVAEIKNLYNLVEGWQKLFSWIETSGYEPVGVVKGEHGWVNSAFEELVNWWENKEPAEWVFQLWVQLKG